MFLQFSALSKGFCYCILLLHLAHTPYTHALYYIIVFDFVIVFVIVIAYWVNGKPCTI